MLFGPVQAAAHRPLLRSTLSRKSAKVLRRRMSESQIPTDAIGGQRAPAMRRREKNGPADVVLSVKNKRILDESTILALEVRFGRRCTEEFAPYSITTR